MGRRVLLSFLGLSDYEYCYYTYGGVTSSYTRFIQTAVYELFRGDEPMDVVVFATKEARDRNGQDRKKGDKLLEGIDTAFRRIAPEANVKIVEIESGQDEQSNWRLFDRIMGEIEEGDTIYFDITHSFRSIPFVALIALNYARLVKQADIGAIVYGWFEVLGRPVDVEQMPAEQRVAPIVDLTSMARLLDWTNGVDQFLRTGDASIIQTLTAKENSAVFRNPSSTQTMRNEVKELNQLTKRLDQTEKVFRTCRSLQIDEEVQKFHEQLARVRSSSVEAIKPLVPLLDVMEKKYAMFDDDPIMNSWKAVRWCLDHGLIQQALTMLEENAVTAVCRVLGFDLRDEKIRGDVHSAIEILLRDIPKEKWRVRSVELVEQIIDFLSPYKGDLKPFSMLKERRNDINHAGARPQPLKAEKFWPDAEQSFRELGVFFERMSALAKTMQVAKENA
ncbi:CRISPR-associated protein [Geobacillus thermocatenulatus]|uniref:CRISPR-associated protein n=1 Tax=Geobacillus thermocatenulatus TaxID=33938 RepID=A0A226Q3X5_9BACL|nr:MULTISPECIES: TIGR02221 family CRISPR-associated protein [Geobacillus]AST00695.1 CRISPR-associated protein [Geobacillus thermocatenulatus]KLR75077.1 CRISPR-associated protein [Geobacillus sp. T6]OXB87061.1 CRISPR-associated protein [Geobacillus thermocatenulatus]